ncbi:HK97-gp10 family putative phage morphogenesis protein [Acinetobacter sp. ANC 5383]
MVTVNGLEEVSRKLKALSDKKIAKRITRKVMRKAINIARDKARENAKFIDDPETSAKIYKNIVVQVGRSRNSGELMLRMGVRSGPEFWRMNKGMFRKSKVNGKTIRVKSPYYTYMQNDTRSWWLVEFGTVKTKAQPFLRPAFYETMEAMEHKFCKEFSAEVDIILSALK